MEYIQRRIDALGRIMIPIAYRHQLGLEERDLVDMTCANGELRVKRSGAPRCALCQTEAIRPIQAAGGHLVCRNCALFLQSKL